MFAPDRPARFVWAANQAAKSGQGGPNEPPRRFLSQRFRQGRQGEHPNAGFRRKLR